jgi:hypothetical protein
MPTGENRGHAGEETTVGWSLLLPSSWYHVHLDARRHRRVEALLRQVLADLPRDTVFPWRRDLQQRINSLLDNALANGGSDFYLLVDPRYALPLAATCLATLVPAPLPAGVAGDVVAHTLADRDGDRPGVLLIGGQECAIVRRVESAVIQDDDAPPGAAVPAMLSVTCLDVFIPVPARPDSERSEQTLLLSFRTPVAAVAEPMMMLFEAITQSLRWTWE